MHRLERLLVCYPLRCKFGVTEKVHFLVLDNFFLAEISLDYVFAKKYYSILFNYVYYCQSR